jgi:manganese-transporting P-type ATPase
LYSPEKKQFSKLTFPVDRPLVDYLQTQGLEEDAVAKGLAVYGENKFDIPLPTFSQLYKEQALAPFFAFQVIYLKK